MSFTLIEENPWLSVDVSGISLVHQVKEMHDIVLFKMSDQARSL